jgi:uroporphyrinogen decarboxylase
MDAVAEIRRALKGRVPLIGFSGSPYTLACYMVEGGGSDDFRLIKSLLYKRPDLLHHILSITTEAVIHYLNAQIEAGAQAVMVFDTWGGSLSHEAYHEFSLPYLEKIAAGLTRVSEDRVVPKIAFTKGGGLWLESLANSGFDALGLDWTLDIGRARARVGTQVALQGNMDPMTLFSTPERIEREVATILQQYGNGSGHIFNLGHGVNQHTPPEHVKVLVDAVHAQSRAYHPL